MSGMRTRRLMLLITMATAMAGGITAEEYFRRPRERGMATEFQRLLGGLGFGGELDLARCGPAFDPRIVARCREDCGLVLCGRGCCGVHSFSVWRPHSTTLELNSPWEADTGVDAD